jgi:hypothetical protein
MGKPYVEEVRMYCIGVDYHKRYSHMTVLDAEGRILKAGTVRNTAEAVRAFVAPYREAGGRRWRRRGTGR